MTATQNSRHRCHREFEIITKNRTNSNFDRMLFKNVDALVSNEIRT